MRPSLDYLQNIARLARSYGFTPIAAKNKVPIGKGWQNLRNDINDPEKRIRQIGHLYNKAGANQISIVTGEASGVVVVDVDPGAMKWWHDLIQINGGLPETFTVQTPSGGLHVYFKWSPRTSSLPNFNKIFGKDIEFRTTGGAVVFAGSTSPDGRYYTVIGGYSNDRPVIAEMPDWLLDLLRANQEFRQGHSQHKPKAIAIDIDGTIANISNRLAAAENRIGGPLAEHPNEKKAYYEVLFNPVLTEKDMPILPAQEYLNNYAKHGEVLYVSGRPSYLYPVTEMWLEKNGFPKGRIYLRNPSQKTLNFKIATLSKLKLDYNIEAYVGDREDDRIAAERVGIPFVYVRENNWI